MKKTFALAVIASAVFSFGMTNAQEVVNLDTVRDTSVMAVNYENQLQKNYLNALRLRYQGYYNRKMMDRDYINLYNQIERHNEAKKNANISGGLKSFLAREGEMETDKERVRRNNGYQTKAVNQKSVFLKRAMDYYVYGGNAGSEVMEKGNINMKDHKVNTRRMLSELYRDALGETLVSTRNLQKGMMGAPKYDNLKKRTVNYRTGDFKFHMYSPYTSLDWL